MDNQESGIQPSHAKLAGIIGLIIVFLALFSEGYVRGSLIVAGDAAQTTQNIAASLDLFRWGMMAEIALLWFDLTYAFLLYLIFRHAGPILARLALIFRIVPIAILGMVALTSWVSIYPLLDTASSGLIQGTDQAQLAMLGTSLHSMGYHIALTFSFFHLGLIGILTIRSHDAPNSIGYMLFVAAACYLVSSTSAIVGIDPLGIPTAILLLPCLIAETALTIWLLVRGVSSRTNQKVR
jgi:hypothetical protein